MVHHETTAPGSATLHCQLLLWLLLVLISRCPSTAQWTSDDQSAEPSDNWQTISNFTVVANGPVNYQLRSFTIEDQVNREVTLLIQANDGPELIKDMKVCSNIAYSIDTRHIFVQSLNPRHFSAVGLYKPKILHQTGDAVLGGQRSLAFDELHQVLFFSNQSRIQAIDYCSEVPKPTTVIYRGLLDVTIGHIAVDAGRGLLLWSESTDSDTHCRLMEAGLDGQHLRQLYESNSSICTAMTVHVPSARLYWVARQTLWSLSYGGAGGAAGGGARVVLRNNNLITDSIQIDPNHRHLYWSSMQRKVVRLSLADVNSASSATGHHSSGKEHKVQMISQLGGQHLLLVAFQVSETSRVEAEDRRCLPLCAQSRTAALLSTASSVTTKSTSITAEDNSAPPHLSPSSPPPPSTTKALTWRSVWTSINGYQLTEQRIVDLLATGVVVVAVYVTLELFRACFRRRASY